MHNLIYSMVIYLDERLDFCENKVAWRLTEGWSNITSSWTTKYLYMYIFYTRYLYVHILYIRDSCILYDIL